MPAIVTGNNNTEDLADSIPAKPSCMAIAGIRFDFNDGARVQVPESFGEVRCRFFDLDEGQIVGQIKVAPGAMVATNKKYFVRHRIEIFSGDEAIFTHDFDATGKDVLIRIAPGTIGDAIAWFPAAIEFQKKHACNLYVTMDERMVELFSGQYPDVHFISKEEANNKLFYATYRIGIVWNDKDNNCHPFDFRLAGLQEHAFNILQIPFEDTKPKLNLSAKRKIKKKYVCISAQSTAYCKTWNNPCGWVETIDFLKANGYRVLCIDRDRVYGKSNLFTYMPIGAEDFTGNLPLQERINLLKDADFFIGLPSGLSWLAWACNIPVVMIGGFSLPYSEFNTPYRVINYNACHGCWNDCQCKFDGFQYDFCPRLRGTAREFECNRLISSIKVINTIKQIIGKEGK